ncbi:hypothetical protein BBC0122_019710 [Bartonella choladocola]|uniref:Uncharacterized protein n=1 Tax=Bartonella choladocola TaxID=2750995 RepID=A0A1U9MJH9_9HYPH|nr:hypothetical protein BBC0122_019710 [Bartonella choladocola]
MVETKKQNMVNKGFKTGHTKFNCRIKIENDFYVYQ